MIKFDLDRNQRKALFEQVINKVDSYYSNTKSYSTTPSLEINQIRDYINTQNLQTSVNYKNAINHVLNGLENYSVHTPHPKYFGLFNPRANFSGILADLITATYNPQLAAWSHAPFAVEVEAKLIKEFGEKFGYKSEAIDGVFTTGGAEANLSALLCALNHSFPEFAKNGVFGMLKRPIIYCSQEAHHSIHKSAKTVGLGYSSVQSIPTDDALKIDLKKLRNQIQEDIASNNFPTMIIGTAGTTGAGTIDDLVALRTIADEFDLWFHVDAAYGGAAVINKEIKPNLKGIETSDSITFDAHKWMSVPMGTSIFLTSHNEILSKTFRISTEYMPKEADSLDIVEPFSHSIQWSRRFIGLKVYLSLLFFGWDGYEQIIGHQKNMGDLFRKKLLKNNWSIKNKTPLPIICFTDDSIVNNKQFSQKILDTILKEGKSWLSTYPIGQLNTFRVCITNYNTSEKELDELIEELNELRKQYLNNI